jgi:hypothetical protein
MNSKSLRVTGWALFFSILLMSMLSSHSYGVPAVAVDGAQDDRQESKNLSQSISELVVAKELARIQETEAAKDRDNLNRLRSFLVGIGENDKPNSEYFLPYQTLTDDLFRKKENIEASLLDGIFPLPKQYDDTHHGSVA